MALVSCPARQGQRSFRKIPAGLEQELRALPALYQALRRAMVTAVETIPGTGPDRAGFTTALQNATQTLIQADGVIPSHANPAGRVGRAVLDHLLPPRPPCRRRKVKSPLGRWNKADPARPARSTAITALTITVTSPQTPPSATRQSQCLTALPGP